jgi:hypothetical protein
MMMSEKITSPAELLSSQKPRCGSKISKAGYWSNRQAQINFTDAAKVMPDTKFNAFAKQEKTPKLA